MEKLSRREFIAGFGAGIFFVTKDRVWGEMHETDDGMILIPGGEFLMGTSQAEAEELAQTYGYHPSWLSGEVPQREVELAAFEIDKYLVTNGQFAEFCEAAGHAPRPHWNGPVPPESLMDHPVTHVNRADAESYARWAGKRLPTEAEWEKAARGTNGRRFPWGNEFDPDACQWNGDRTATGPGTAPVTAHPAGVSPYGAMDMAGNVAEYCADGPAPGVAYIKGGCWLTGEIINLRPAARNMSGSANNASILCGFRCAREAR